MRDKCIEEHLHFPRILLRPDEVWGIGDDRFHAFYIARTADIVLWPAQRCRDGKKK